MILLLIVVSMNSLIIDVKRLEETFRLFAHKREETLVLPS
jgi:hypothetical protein